MIAVEELGKGSDVCSPADHPNPVIPLLSSARLACKNPTAQCHKNTD